MDFGFNFISPCDSVTEKTIEFLAVDMTPSVFVREREGGRKDGSLKNSSVKMRKNSATQGVNLSSNSMLKGSDRNSKSIFGERMMFQKQGI